MTHKSTWKRRERQAAATFGSQRQIGSGSGGRADRTRSDSTHDRLYIETKLRASSSVRSLWERTRDHARRERKTPLLMLFTKSKPGALCVVHADDLMAVAAELLAAADNETILMFEAKVRSLRGDDAPGQEPEPSEWIQDPEPFHPGDET